ncbi:MAG: hypothetical protein MJZ86_08315 [Bacteroidales bacterium]|nr:hypothetical protein [Bacteroidales bacterium]
MKRSVFLIVAVLLSMAAAAQTQDDYQLAKQQMIAQFKNSKVRDVENFLDFRKKANEEYSQSLRKAWQTMHPERKHLKFSQPKPPSPTVCMPERRESPVAVSCNSFSHPEAVAVPTIASLSVSHYSQNNASIVHVPFFGTDCNIHAEPGMAFALPSLQPSCIANAWESLSKPLYDGLVRDCLEIGGNLQLCDWAYIMLTKTVSEKLLDGALNESVLLQAYLLAQSGMKVKLCTSDNHLFLMLPFAEPVYEYYYLTIEGLRYYIIGGDEVGSVSVCQGDFYGGRQPSVLINRYPVLSKNLASAKIVRSKRYPDFSFQVRPNLNLIHFLNTVPRTNKWGYYAHASLSIDVKEQIYPKLTQLLNGRSETESVNMLLNLVQTGFDYATDQEQFGKEMPLFGDQTIYYPYSDCEDRAILFSILVREIVGLKVVLLGFPGHLAAAVMFSSDVSGDYVVVDGNRYLVCDPTYIGASFGMMMPQFAGESVEVIGLD